MASVYNPQMPYMWIIDQMIRVLLGENEYKNFVNAYQIPDGEDYYTWDMGVVPQNLHFMCGNKQEDLNGTEEIYGYFQN